MKSNLSRWGLSRYYITKEGILYFKTLNKSGPNHPNYDKPPHNKLSLRKERRVLRLYYKGLNIKGIQLRLRLKSSTSIRRILKNHSLLK